MKRAAVVKPADGQLTVIFTQTAAGMHVGHGEMIQAFPADDAGRRLSVKSFNADQRGAVCAHIAGDIRTDHILAENDLDAAGESRR